MPTARKKTAKAKPTTKTTTKKPSAKKSYDHCPWEILNLYVEIEAKVGTIGWQYKAPQKGVIEVYAAGKLIKRRTVPADYSASTGYVETLNLGLGPHRIEGVVRLNNAKGELQAMSTRTGEG